MNLDRIRSYCGEPTEVDRAGFIYPVRLIEWERFTQLASMYLMTCDLFLRRRLSLSDEIKLFDFVTIQAVLASKDGEERLKELEELFSIVFRTQVQYRIRKTTKMPEIYFLVNKMGIIDRDNYEEVRRVIMEQNILFDPIIGKSEAAQQAIDNAIARLKRGKTDLDIESMFIAVSMFKKDIDINEITYYQLRADYEMLTRIEQNRIIPIYQVNGVKIEQTELSKPLSIHKNPYGMDVLFKKRDDNKVQSMMKS